MSFIRLALRGAATRHLASSSFCAYIVVYGVFVGQALRLLHERLGFGQLRRGRSRHGR